MGSTTTLRLSAAVCLVCASAASGVVRADEHRESGNVLFEASVFNDGDALLVNVEVDRKLRVFVVNTSATLTTLDEAFRSTLGPRRRTVSAETPLGRIDVDIFPAPDMRLGTLSWEKGSEVACTDLSGFRESTGHQVDGFLGMDFLERHVVRLDYEKGLLQILRCAPADSGESMVIGRQSKVAVVYLDFPGGFSRGFRISTASNSGLTVRSGVGSRLVRGGHAEYVSSIAQVDLLTGKSVAASTGVCRDVRLGEITLARSAFTESNLNEIGNGFLRRFVVTLDFPKSQIYLQRRVGENDLGNLISSGVTLARVKQHVVVRSVSVGSAADQGGIVVGDRVIRIDGKEARALRLLEISRILMSPSKDVRMALSRDGKTREVTVSIPSIKTAP